MNADGRDTALPGWVEQLLVFLSELPGSGAGLPSRCQFLPFSRPSVDTISIRRESHISARAASDMTSCCMGTGLRRPLWPSCLEPLRKCLQSFSGFMNIEVMMSIQIQSYLMRSVTCNTDICIILQMRSASALKHVTTLLDFCPLPLDLSVDKIDDP